MAPDDNSGGSSIYSPSGSIGSGFNVGGGPGGSGESTIHPDFQVAGQRGPEASGTKEVGEVAGVGSTADAVPFAQLATNAPESYSPGADDPMVEGLGTPPRP